MDFFISLVLSILSIFWGGTSDQSEVPVFNSAVIEYGQVQRVVDGDTIVVQIDGEDVTVRYIGIDTPEPYRDGEPACFSLEASLKNEELVGGKTVRLESDQENTDRFDRLLRYVYVDEVFVNAELIKEGYAKSLKVRPNTKYANDFLQMEQTARGEKIGLWGKCAE